VPGGSSKVEEGRFLEALCLLRDAAPRRRLLRTLPPPIATPLRAPPRGGEKWEGVVGDMWALPPPIAESPEPTRGGGGERTSPRVRRVPSNAPAAHRLARIVDWRGQGSDFAAEGGGGTGSSAPPARAARTATPPRWGAFRPPCLVSACACQPAGRSGRPPRPGRKAAADGGGDSASMPASSTIPPKLFHVGGEAEVLLQRPAIRGDGEANWPACSRGKKGASSKDAWAWIASRTGRQITPAWPGRRPRARRGPLARREPAAGDLGDAGEHRAEDAVQQPGSATR
ncbi:unnamed protein product, partial [Prorocentrum cordatum]